jgi:hypothetical protein
LRSRPSRSGSKPSRASATASCMAVGCAATKVRRWCTRFRRAAH